MNFRRFEHVNQACRNLEAACQFYQTLFPDWYIRAEGDAYGARWMHLGNDQFYLSLYQVSGQAESSSLSTGHIDHVGFVIEDGDQMKAILEANSIKYITETSPETKHRIYVTDPDGTQIELVEYHHSYVLK